MEKLTVLRHGDLRQAEYERFITQFLSDFDASKISLSSTTLLNMIGEMRTCLSQLKRAKEKVVITESADAIAVADEERDDDLAALLSSTKLFSKSRDTAEKEAYEHLTKVFTKYKATVRANYETETTQIEHLLEQLKDEMLVAAVETLGLNRFVERLTKSQAQFVTLYNSRSTTNATKVVFDSKAAHKELYSLYQDFSDLVTIYQRRNPDAVPAELFQVLNNSRKRYADILSHRKGIAKKDKEPTE